MRTPLLLALAAVAYCVAAWAVAPGFYDGFAPQPNYNWVSPPPQFKAGNLPPKSRHAEVPVLPDGQVSGERLITPDSQIQIGFTPGAFSTPPGRSPLSIDIRPVASFPNPGPIHLSTNVYCVSSANSTLDPARGMTVVLVYSTGIPQPGAIYMYEGAGPWRALPTSVPATPFTVSSVTKSLGCFAGGFTGSASGGPGINPLLIGVVVAILFVVLAGVPLILLQRKA